MRKSKYKKQFVLLFAALIVLGTAYLAYTKFAPQTHVFKDYPASEASTTAVIPVSAAQVPDGWYAHEVGGYDGLQTILTKTKELLNADPANYAYGEHIAIVERSVGPTAEEYLKKNAYPKANDPAVQFATWSTLYGRKMFSIGFTNPNDGSRQQSIYLYGDRQIVLINLYPDKQENRTAFQQVVNYYAQTLPIISRDETLAACKTVVLPPGQEYDIQADPETGYVTVGYYENSVQQHAFFNYNDDLSQCTSSIKDMLERAKGHSDTMPQ